MKRAILKAIETGREVSAKAVKALLSTVRSQGYSTDSLMVNTPFTCEDFDNRSLRISWTSFKTIMENTTSELHLSDEELIQIGRASLRSPVLNVLGFLTSMVFTLPETYSLYNGDRANSFGGDLFNCINFSTYAHEL